MQKNTSGCQKDYPDSTEADNILTWAAERNPGPWEAHSRTVARAAQTIAAKCALDAEKAYALGLLHDIGRYEGPRGLHHVYAGYKLMAEKGFDAVARICLSHSFPYQHMGAYSGASGSDSDCTPDEIAELDAALTDLEYDDYDMLVQLCDCIGIPAGVCLIDVRLIDVSRRQGVNDFTVKKWEAFFRIKARFDEICGMNIYDLFYDEIRAVSFGKPGITTG